MTAREHVEAPRLGTSYALQRAGSPAPSASCRRRRWSNWRGRRPTTSAAPAAGLPSTRLHQNIEWVERETIRRALDQAGGIKKDAAELMGISQRALSHYLAKYRIDS